MSENSFGCLHIAVCRTIMRAWHVCDLPSTLTFSPVVIFKAYKGLVLSIALLPLFEMAAYLTRYDVQTPELDI